MFPAFECTVEKQHDLVTIGKIERPFGVRGEVYVRSLSDVPGRFEGLAEVTVTREEVPRDRLRVDRCRPTKGGYILHFEGISSPEEAARFRGALINIGPDQAQAPTVPGQFYEFQLIGMAVQDESGERLGCLEDIIETPGHHVFVVRGEGVEHLVPATKDVVRHVDVAARTMTVRWAAFCAGASDAV